MSVNNTSQDEISIVLLDNDPIFTLGFKEVLKTSEYQDINIIATGKISEFTTLLSSYQPSLWLISLDINRYGDKVNEFLNYLPLLSQKLSNISIVLLLSSGFILDVNNIPIIKGFCYKDADIEELIKTLRICGKGENCFNVTNANIKSKKIHNWFSQQCQIGLKEIQQEMNNIEDYLQEKKLSLSDVLFWQGRKRELKLAKWLISQMMPNSYQYFVNDNSFSAPRSIPEYSAQNNNPIPSEEIVLRDTPKNTYDLTLAKIKASVKNATGNLLEIDILQESKKQELLIIILDEWINQINELANIQIEFAELPNKINIFIKDIWQNSAIKFLSRYYQPINDNAYDLVDLILKESTIIQEKKLIKIPFILEIIDYQINQKPLVIDSQIYDYDTESGRQLEEIIWQNIIINVANAVIGFTLNRFYDDISIKQTLFTMELKSSRKVAMFRNNLVWEYRQQKYWQNPQNIFEDKFKMFKLSYQGINTCIITHPRHEELNSIKGLPWLVTILIELRDSLSKGIKSLEKTLGSALIYILTEIIGKGIGLIGKGILQGIGKRIRN